MTLRSAFTLVFILGGSSLFAAQEPTAEGLAFFEKEIRPILSGSCYSCHSEKTKVAGGLRVDDYRGLLDGGDEGPAIIPGDAEKSLLIQRVTHGSPNRVMPQESEHLTEEQISKLRQWITLGAPWPKERYNEKLTEYPEQYKSLVENHWAWQKVNREVLLPRAESLKSQHEVDRFIFNKLEEKKIDPVKAADRVTLLRRIFFDLTGLPPKPEDLQQFAADENPEALNHWMDRLLASPAFGEKWGRHWLDVARYGESTGPSRNIPYPHAWKYRDYVIDALNRDIPFDRFITEQIAGDLLPVNSQEEQDRLKIATGFLALGVKDVNQRFKTRFVMDQVDEKIETVTRSILALTVSCARCHDHKFDPIPATDYYALAGIFTSTEDCTGVRNKMGGGGLDYYHPEALLVQSVNIQPVDPKKVAEAKAKVQKAQEAFNKIRDTKEGQELLPNGQRRQRAFRLRLDQARTELASLDDLAARGYGIHGVRESKVIANTAYRIRGEAERLGPEVQRGFLSLFQLENTPVVPDNQSGRLQLAEWLVHPENPLTARVMVNRIWKHLFGEGLVKSVDNFGVTGEKPTHPELLDYLANRFIEEGWSVKSMVKYLLLSDVYQLSSEDSALAAQRDPSNQFLWRHTPRRLEAEELRDTMLLVSGQLRHGQGLGSEVAKLPMVEVRDNAEAAQSIYKAAADSKDRSVYLPLMRGLTPSDLAAFDPVEQTLVTGRRDSTTVATQALFMMNSEFVQSQAKSVTTVWNLTKESDASKAVQGLFWSLLNRAASLEEVQESVAFLTHFDGDSSANQSQKISEKAWQAFIHSIFASAEFRFIH